MPHQQALAKLACLLVLSWVGQAPARAEDYSAHTPNLSNSEHKRMRSDLERFSREQPRRGDFEKRRQFFRERARQRFHDADTDGNSLLNREEWTRLHPAAARNFDEIDQNGDGELSEQEVAQVLRKRIRNNR